MYFTNKTNIDSLLSAEFDPLLYLHLFIKRGSTAGCYHF